MSPPREPGNEPPCLTIDIPRQENVAPEKAPPGNLQFMRGVGSYSYLARFASVWLWSGDRWFGGIRWGHNFDLIGDRPLLLINEVRCAILIESNEYPFVNLDP